MAKRRRRSGRWKPVLVIVPVCLLLVPLLVILPFRWLPPPTTSFMLHAQAGGLGSGAPCASIRWDWVDQDQFAPVIGLAVIAAEDQNFPSHAGLDFRAISTAMKERQTGGRLRGASTITQQLVKNMYLWPGQSWLRKGLEAWLTLIMEATWPKRRILEVYLNVVQFGRCTFGVQAASERFFTRPASGLTGWEAARLAAVLPNPVQYRVDQPTEYVRERTEWILQQMRLLGGTGYLQNL